MVCLIDCKILVGWPQHHYGSAVFWVKTRNPSLNRTDSAPTCSKLWDPIIPKIACTIKPRPAGISFLKTKRFYYFSIFYYLRFLLLTSVKESTASPQVTDTLPLIIFTTGTDTTQPFIYHRSHHIHPWLKKTGTCLLKASNILLYYFVSIKSLLSTTLLTRMVNSLFTSLPSKTPHVGVILVTWPTLD